MDGLLEAVGKAQGLTILAKDESPLAQIGRPDFAVSVDRLLCGYIELKAPGTGTDPRRYKGHNKQQWEKFKHLPNLVYTDGNEWTLFRTGEVVRRVRFPDDLTLAGPGGLDAPSVADLGSLLTDFFQWQPIVPRTAKQLAELLAPLCRMLRDDVLDAIAKRSDAMRSVAADWRRYLFPDASDAVFADSYAQTVVFALLLARSDGSDTLLLDQAVKQLTGSNSLLARALEVLTDSQLADDIGASLGLLQRVIREVPTGTMTHGRRDPWLHFYEDFLAEYDPKLRKDAGAYYTPVEVVQAQVRLVDELLRGKFDKPLGFADGDVATLDPAVGTGTYLLGIVEHALERVKEVEGEGAVKGRAESLIKQLYGFELMVGPYAVAALRLTRAMHDRGARLPQQGVGVCLNNTLESPHEKIPELPLLYKPIGDQHKRARAIKDMQPVLVCIGNPPYDRHAAATKANHAMTGAWVRWGEADHDAILDDFIAPVKAAKKGGQLKNLYNLYVYFWRWALWKVFEHEHAGLKPGPGVVSFITASSYLDGDAFLGMRAHLRREADEIWIVDLGGEGRGTRQDDNVFSIQTPVAIAIVARYGALDPDTPATVRYCRLEGARQAKLDRLESIAGFGDLTFAECPTGWAAPFRPKSEAAFFEWPKLADLMPWQHSGVEGKRTWPIGVTREVLSERWRGLLEAGDRAVLFRESTDRKVNEKYKSLWSDTECEQPLSLLQYGTPCPRVMPYGYRSFDRQHVIADNRLLARSREALWQSLSDQQVFLAGYLTSGALGGGPALTLSTAVPDRHYFSGRGAKDILPLYRDAQARLPNLHPDLIQLLAQRYGHSVEAEDVAAYLYAVLAHPGYAARFSTELENREVRVPLTCDAGLFAEAVVLGRRLIYLHSYGERFQAGQSWPAGLARCTRPVGDDLPVKYAYDPAEQRLEVGQGRFQPVSPAVWAFEVSGLKVVQSWLGYRLKTRKGKKSSPLDDIAPEGWPSEFTSELLKLLHLLEETVATYPAQAALFERILAGALLDAGDLAEPPEPFRKAPAAQGGQDAWDV
ncbi:MAG TPA: type ISP restriction/modification enzyme [Parasulfuritortus sp.]